MTPNHTYANGQKVGRDKQWEKRLTLPLTSEMVDRLDAVKRPGEDRLSVIRKGIERELKARERKAHKESGDEVAK